MSPAVQPRNCALLIACAMLLAACATTRPQLGPRYPNGNPSWYVVNGHRYRVLQSADGYVARGVASWYGHESPNRTTADGEPFDPTALTAAHKTLPLPTYARVTNLRNGLSVVVRINDRGPFVPNRLIDLSYGAALRLDMLRTGTALVEVRAISTRHPDTASSSLPLPAVAAAPAASAPAWIPAPASISAAPGPASGPQAVPDMPAGAGTDVARAPARLLYVQAGAFARLANAQRLLIKLKAAGLAAFMLPADAERGLYRVRVGPVAGVADFDAVAARLAQLGIRDAQLTTD